MIRTLETITGRLVQHDDEVGEQTIRKNNKLFFDTKFGARETYTFYRGFVIVRTTVRFGSGPSTRETLLYAYYDNSLYIVGKPSDQPESISDAKKLADKVLETDKVRPPE